MAMDANIPVQDIDVAKLQTLLKAEGQVLEN
jgi:hypothetical protein